MTLAALVAAAVLSAAGTVKSVSSSSLVVATKGGGDLTFMLDDRTKFVGKGVAEKSKAAGVVTATDVIGEGDAVSVAYHDMGSMLHAATVRITGKAKRP